MKRLTRKQADAMRLGLIQAQSGLCMLCGIDLAKVRACLDHDHKSGRIRDVLCLNCNGIEGKIFNLARRAKRAGTEESVLDNILSYWDKHLSNPRDVYHPNHRTPDEKRVARNAKARAKRRAKKGV